MANWLLACALVALVLPCTMAAVPSDEILQLPGWNYPMPSRMWSGHIPAGVDSQDGTTYNFHYWYVFVEAEVEDPMSVPLLVWSNGGPGAASSYGLFAEFGPLILSDQSFLTPDYNATGVPSLFYNPHAWTKAANILIVNGGGPVGYTYCDCSGARTDCSPSGNGTRCGNWDDYRTKAHNTQFVLNWLSAFPEYAQLPMFLVGESYAGVYMPMLFEGLLDSPNPPNLVGLGLGDACMGTEVVCGAKTGPWFELMFLGGHGCISMPTWQAVLDLCPHDRLKDGQLDNVSQACKNALAQSNTECNWDMFYAYNYYDKCPGTGIHAAPITYISTRFGDVPSLPSSQPNGYPCGGDAALAEWIQTAPVKKAMHVAPESVYFSGDNGVGFNYTINWPSSLETVKRLHDDGVHRVLAYNGDTDPAITSFVTQNWTSYLNYSVVEQWRPFTTDGQQAVAGYVVTYEGNLQFASIRGSGHMVPLYAPRESLVMLQSWMQNVPFPKFVPPTTTRSNQKSRFSKGFRL